MFFGRKRFEEKTEKKIEEINNALISSFSNVKRDASNIFQWIEYLYQQLEEQKQLAQEIRAELKHQPASEQQLKEYIDRYYSLEPILNRITELRLRMDRLSLTNDPAVASRINELNQRIDSISQRILLVEKKPEQKLNIREKIIKKITKNSKEYIKNIILNFIRKYEKASALQLREIIVDEQGLCSKSSFYRLLDELEKEDNVAVFQQGKEKYYMYKIKKYT